MACRKQAIQFASYDEETEYNSNLYKAILPVFISSIDACQLKECPDISKKLTVEEMQIVQKEYENKGQNSAARTLLGYLCRKPDWFSALMMALDCPDLKLTDFKLKFLDAQAMVDNDWLATHPQTSPSHRPSSCQRGEAHLAPVCNPSMVEPRSPVQSHEEIDHHSQWISSGMEIDKSRSRAPVTVSDGSGGTPTSDFCLSVTGLEKDTVEEMDTDPSENAMPDPSTHTVMKGEDTAGPRQRDSTGENEDSYTDAFSSDTNLSDYDMPEHYENGAAEYIYKCIERDAVPIPMQPSDIPQEEVGIDAEPGIQQVQRRRRQRPQTREEHPSLSRAISFNPSKDFDAVFVSMQLSSLPGWSSRQEEHKVIHALRAHMTTNGYYIIWYWSLAKRPTVCVVQNGRMITFVVHKSTTAPCSYYFNKHQKRCGSLHELIRFHCGKGILYKPQDGPETTVHLKYPYTRHQHPA